MSKWTPENIPNCFYRVSIKALILNETRDKFLIVQEDNGKWELPGGGLDFEANPHEDLAREIAEEMNLVVKYVAEHPSYFITGMKNAKGFWNVNLLYETELESLDFTPTEECVEIKFIGQEDRAWLASVDSYDSIPKLLAMFDPKRHD